MGESGYFVVRALKLMACFIMRALDFLRNNLLALLMFILNVGLAIRQAICNLANAAPWPIDWLLNVVCVTIGTVVMGVGSFTGAVIWLLFEALVGLVSLFLEAILATALAAAWLIHWALKRFADYVICRQHVLREGLHTKPMKIHFVVISYDDSARFITDNDLDLYEQATRGHLTQCGIAPTFTRAWLNHPSYSTKVRGDLDELWFPTRYIWYMCHAQVFEPTVFFVDEMYRPGRAGETLPVFTLWSFVKKGVDRVVVAHELCHLCDIFEHTDFPDRIMRSSSIDGQSTVFSPQERCFWNTTHFAR